MSSLKPVLLPLGVTAGCACMASVTALGTLSALTPWPWTEISVDWGDEMYSIYHDLMQVSHHYEGLVSPVAPGEFGIVICNHPSTFGLSQLAYYVGHNISRSIRVVTKHDLELILRLPLNALELSVPINRNDREAAKRVLTQQIPELSRLGGVLILLPDGTRPSAKKRTDAREKWIERIPDFDKWSTLPPRSGSLLAILQSLDRPVPIYNITQGFNVFDEGWLDVHRLYGAQYHITCDQFMSNELPLDEAQLQAWLVHDWRQKNRLKEKWCSSTRA